MDPRVLYVIALMKNRMGRKLTLAELARAVNLTPEHLCRVFRAETGQTPANYLKRLRVERAEELLETTFLSLKEIVNAVGAGDESHFRRDFKKICGLTPAQYRARHHIANLNGFGAISSSAGEHQFSP